MELFRRDKYLKKIRGFYHDTDMIKVITGVRRCGKSSLMKVIMDELKEENVSDEKIVFLDLDSRKFKGIKTAGQLEKMIEQTCVADGTKYLFIDEIQNVEGFEEVINAYRGEGEHYQ